MSDSPRIFADFVEGRLTEAQCRQQLNADAQWLARLDTCIRLQRVAKAPAYDAVPYVDTRSMFQAQWGHQAAQRQDFWPKLAVACSLMAIAISLSPLKLQVNDGSIAMHWGQHDAKQVEQVTQMLASYRLEQQDYLQKHLQLQQQQQASQLILLKDYLTEAEQKNRRSDMLELVEYLNMQRQADWQYWQDHAQPSQARLDYSAAPSYKRQP